MADVNNALLSEQLNKLKKHELIFVIINKKLPSSAVMNEEALDMVNTLLGSENKIVGDSESGAVECRNCASAKLQVHYSKLELSLKNTLIHQMEERIGEQKDLITILKNSKDLTKIVNSEKNKNNENKSETVRKEISTLMQNKTELKTATSIGNDSSGAGGRKLQSTSQASAGANKQKTVTTIKGTGAENQLLKSTNRRAWIYVGKVDKNCDEDRLLEFLRAKFVGRSFSVEKISKEEHGSNAFKVGFNFELLEEITTESFWPNGIIIRRFRFFRAYQKK